MAKAKNWILTDLSVRSVALLTIDGVGEFDISQFSLNYGLNKMPRAMVLVATGRDMRNSAAFAKIHDTGALLQRMQPAWITFAPEGEWDSEGRKWEGEQVVMRGYYSGMEYQMVSGKLQPILNITHLFIDLTGSSVLSGKQHASNPASLVMPASETLGAGAQGKPEYITCKFGHDTIRNQVTTDLWAGLKTLLCNLAQDDKFRLQCSDIDFSASPNTRALNALSRIEGPAENCNLKYKLAKPLKLNNRGVGRVDEAVADAVIQQTMSSVANSDFWSVLVGLYCPMFRMCLVPLPEGGLVVADTPTLRAEPWKTLGSDEYSFVSAGAISTLALNAVGVYSGFESLTRVAISRLDDTAGSFLCFGGVYQSSEPEDVNGLLMAIPPPAWLKGVTAAGAYAANVLGINDNSPVNTDSQPAIAELPDDPAVAEIPGEDTVSQIQKLYESYAHTIYVSTSLLGRRLTLSSKLRFDIAPGSLLRLDPQPQEFYAGVDSLAVPLYGHVAEVSINVNCEASRAETTLHLTHIRSSLEYDQDNVSVTEHPLFGKDVYTGAPLVSEWAFR